MQSCLSLFNTSNLYWKFIREVHVYNLAFYISTKQRLYISHNHIAITNAVPIGSWRLRQFIIIIGDNTSCLIYSIWMDIHSHQAGNVKMDVL